MKLKFKGGILIVICVVSLIALFLNESNENKKVLAVTKKIQEEEQIEYDEVQNTFFEKVNNINKSFKTDLPGIICWGDSLTMGAGGNGVTYPKVIASELSSNINKNLDFSSLLPNEYKYLSASPRVNKFNVPVINMGVGGEQTDTILGRNGVVPMTIGKDFTIPKSRKGVAIDIEGGSPLRQGNAGLELVSIGGVEGTLSIRQDSYTFSRNKEGESVNVNARTPIIPEYDEEYLTYLPVIFMGQNGGWDNDPAVLIEQQRAIINHQTANQDKYIIVGLHTLTASERSGLENAMTVEYGNQYINLREYMSSQQAVDDANNLGYNIHLSEQDQADMKNGKVPKCFLSDEVHFNEIGYQLVGNLIYNRMNDLGYFNAINMLH